MTDATFWQGAFRDHGGEVLAFLASRMPRRQDAEDLLQETFVRAIRSSARLQRRESVRSYLFSIAHHLSLNHLRRRREVLFSEGGEGIATAVEAMPAREAGPEAEARLADLVRAIPPARDRLGPALARAFDLGVVERRPYAEIAAQTGWSLAQVRVNIHRARKRMLRELGLDKEVQ